jgi:hypothetical protein
VLALDQVKDNREPMYRDRMLQLIDDLLSLGAVPSLTMPDKVQSPHRLSPQVGPLHGLIALPPKLIVIDSTSAHGFTMRLALAGLPLWRSF